MLGPSSPRKFKSNSRSCPGSTGAPTNEGTSNVHSEQHRLLMTRDRMNLASVLLFTNCLHLQLTACVVLYMRPIVSFRFVLEHKICKRPSCRLSLTLKLLQSDMTGVHPGSPDSLGRILLLLNWQRACTNLLYACRPNVLERFAVMNAQLHSINGQLVPLMEHYVVHPKVTVAQ